MATLEELISRKWSDKESPVQNANAIIEASRISGVPLPVLVTLIERESHGANIYGNDVGGIFGRESYAEPRRYDKEVTEENYEVYYDWISQDKRSNGQGPAQITFPGFHFDARKRGFKMWKPLDNILYGALELARYLRENDNDLVKAGTLYRWGPDGTDTEYGEYLATRSKVWETRLQTNEKEKDVTSMLTGLKRVLDNADTGHEVHAVPGWETRTGFDSGYRDIYGTIIHTSETNDSTFDKGGDAPTLNWVVDADKSIRGAHTYAILIGRSGKPYLIGAGPGWQAGSGKWPEKVAGKNPGVPDNMANLHTIGISMDANSSKYPVTEAQLNSLVKILVALDKEWGTKLKVIMHGEWNPAGRTDPTRVPGGWGAIREARDRGYWSKPVTAPVAAPVSTGGVVPEYVIIGKDDTLWKLSTRYGISVKDIKSRNPGIDANNLQVGQKVTLANTYTVVKGDTLWRISRRTGTPVLSLLLKNGIKDSAFIYPGQVLVV